MSSWSLSKRAACSRLSLIWLLGCAFALTVSGCGSLFGDETQAGGGTRNRGTGEACESSGQCRVGLVCDDGICAPAGDREAGSPCMLTAECAEALYCSPTLTCTEAGTADIDESCSQNGDCLAGLFCEYRGFSGTCQEAGTGDAGAECVTSSECQAGLGCGPTMVCMPGLPAGGIVWFDGVECETREYTEGDPVQVLFDVPRSGVPVTEFYTLPFPNDIRFSGGHLNLDGHPHPELDTVGNVLLTLKNMMETDVRGFGPHQTVYFRFNTFPQVESLRVGGDDPVLYLVNIDSGSANYGRHQSLGWSGTDGSGKFICNNWLGVHPYWNEPFESGAVYAAIITDGLLGPNGESPQPSADFTAVIGGSRPSDGDLGAAWDAYSPLRSYLADNEIATSSLMGAAVFTIADPSARYPGIRNAVYAEDPLDDSQLMACAGDAISPCEDGLSGEDHTRGCFGESDEFIELHTLVSLPIYQDGVAPYLEQGGSFIFDEDGNAIRQGTQQVCTSIAIPRGQTMPTGGWPTVIYAHGTGGNFRGHLNSYGEDLADLGYAIIGFDQAQHYTRRGDSELDPTDLFFNYINPRAALGNVMQGTADVISFGRFASEFTLPAGASPIGAAIEFDDNHLVFFGHSQGSTVGPAALSVDDAYVAAILSGGGGGLLLSLLEKTEPLDIAGGIALVLQDGVLSDFHPMLNLIQMYFEEVDPLNNASLIYNRSEGLRPLHVFQSFGIGDSYTPDRTMQELANAIGLRLLTPVIAGFGNPDNYLSPPLRGNITLDGSSYTAAVAQYSPPAGEDGHFVIFDVESARTQVLGFLETLLTDAEGVPTIP